ncbi:MAG: hypothetical protein QJR09_11255 [Micrococcus sp.]|nr:hypothetical protein [Micrococcus sp.]
MNDQILWLILALAVVLLIVAIVVVIWSRRRARKREADRREAELIRHQAARQQDMVAAEAEAAEAAQREAEAAEERARQLRAEADERQQEADSAASALDAQLREADRKDPSVATDREGRRRDGSDPLEELSEQDQPGAHVVEGQAGYDGGAPGTGDERWARRDVDGSVRRDEDGRAVIDGPSDEARPVGEARPADEADLAGEPVREDRRDLGEARGVDGDEDGSGSHAAGR